MVRSNMPITPEVLYWARQNAGFSMGEVARKFPKYEEWENGLSFPTYFQLERLAKHFQVSTPLFFFPSPPELPPIRESFRTLAARKFDALPTEIRFLLRKAKVFQLNLYELNDGENPARKPVFRDCQFPIDVNISDHADYVREYLSHTIEAQKSWRDTDQAFDNFRMLLEEHGVAVFKDSFRVSEYSGFCLYDKEFPLIYINNSAKTRQIFTLFHELAHLLFKTSGLDQAVGDRSVVLGSQNERTEHSCNEFAHSFLLPQEDFELSFGRGPYTREKACELADQFNVSREVIYRRFLDRELISQEEYVRAAQHWADQASLMAGGGNYYRTQLAYLGINYTELAFRRYNEQRISGGELANYLQIKEKNLAKFEDYFLEKIS